MLKTLAKRFGVKADGFEKCPSVMTGGKPSFWYRRDATGRQWIVWDRIQQDWIYKTESY